MAQKVQRLSYFSVMMYHLTGERAYRGSADSPPGFLKLTTTGRKSGKQRSTHLIYIRDGSAYVVTASNGGRQRHPGWFYNARSNPQVTIQVQDTQLSAVAEVAGPEKRTASNQDIKRSIGETSTLREAIERVNAFERQTQYDGYSRQQPF